MRVFILIFFIVFSGCKSNNKIVETNTATMAGSATAFSASPHILVYKTREDYNNRVPVILSADKSEIVSYPDPKDLKSSERYSLPSKLSGGYLLDNRGIGVNVAFLSLTYQEYAGLNQAPSVKELYNLILDKDPLTELYDCGTRNTFKDPVKQIDRLIRSNKLQEVSKKIK